MTNDNQKTQDLLRGLFEGANMEHAQVNIFTAPVSKVTYREAKSSKEAPHFPLNQMKQQGVPLFEFLVHGQYIAADSSMASWLYLMGYSTQQPDELKPIRWLRTKQQLRVMLKGAMSGMLENDIVRLADIERLVPSCFVDAEGEPLSLAKPKTEFSAEIDEIEKFFRPKSDL